MVSVAKVKKLPTGWWVDVEWGPSLTEYHGPYRWRWLARLKAWWEDGQH